MSPVNNKAQQHRESLPGQREHPWTVLSEVAKRKEAQRERCKGHRRLGLEGWLGDEFKEKG